MTAQHVSTYFDAGSDAFIQWMPTLWDPLGRALTDAVQPSTGARVLDVCCGAGSSALPAATAVGADGWVDAVDLARGLLSHGKAQAESCGLHNVEFTCADVTTWPSDGYDVVQSGFGVFFLPDMDDAVDGLIARLKPGGRFAVTTWCEDSMAEAFEPFFAALGEHCPDVLAAEKPPFSRNSERLSRADTLTDWMSTRGLVDIQVRRHEHQAPLQADTGWQFLMSGPVQSVLTGLDADTRRQVHDAFARNLQASGSDVLRAPCHVAVGAVRAA